MGIAGGPGRTRPRRAAGLHCRGDRRVIRPVRRGTRTAHRRLGTLDCPVGIDVLAQIMGMPRRWHRRRRPTRAPVLVLIGADGRLQACSRLSAGARPALATDETGGYWRPSCRGDCAGDEEDAKATSPWLADFG